MTRKLIQILVIAISIAVCLLFLLLPSLAFDTSLVYGGF